MRSITCLIISFVCLSASGQTSAPRNEALANEINGMFRSAVIDTSNHISVDKYGGIRSYASNFEHGFNIRDMGNMIASDDGITFICNDVSKCIKTMKKNVRSSSSTLMINLTSKSLSQRIIDNLKKLQGSNEVVID